MLVKEASETMDTWLLTSGSGLTAERAEQLKNGGLTGVHISLDHWDPAQNNRFRNHPSAFDISREAVDHSLRTGMLVSLSLCVTRDFTTEENLMKYLKLARELGVHFVRILEPRAAGKLTGRDIHLTREQAKVISDFAVRMNSDTSFRDFPIIEFLGYHQQKMDCFGAGNRFLYVDPNGDVHACPFCRGKTGNLLKEPAEEILSRNRSLGCPFRKEC
jgi:MoaA/NifB/PqqE/SkfB family radical SAM enzyme